MPEFAKQYLSDLALLHGFNTKHAVKHYCDNTMDIAGDMLNQAGIDLIKFKGKHLPVKLVIFLRKINPTWEDLFDEKLKSITLHQLFPDKFPDSPPNTPQIVPSLPQQSENDQ